MPERAERPKIERVLEQLPPGKVPGSFARDFARIFAPEIQQRFGGAACADNSRSGSPK